MFIASHRGEVRLTTVNRNSLADEGSIILIVTSNGKKVGVPPIAADNVKSRSKVVGAADSCSGEDKSVSRVTTAGGWGGGDVRVATASIV